MPWRATTEVDLFLTEAEPFLVRDAVANNTLLTEAHFWARLPGAEGGLFGWWRERGEVEAAFVLLPDHPMLCSPLPRPAAAGLATAVPDAVGVGVEASDVEAVVASYATLGVTLGPAARLTLLRRQEAAPMGPLPEGHARPAIPRDLPLLHEWFRVFQAQHPEDRSHVAFVVDHPLQDGGIAVWERDGRPVAFASRTPTVASTTRMGLAFQPDGGAECAGAAFDAACAEAARVADHVLVLCGSGTTPTYESRGFVPVLERVVLRRATGDPGQS